jgi:hypothetical protein
MAPFRCKSLPRTRYFLERLHAVPKGSRFVLCLWRLPPAFLAAGGLSSAAGAPSSLRPLISEGGVDADNPGWVSAAGTMITSGEDRIVGLADSKVCGTAWPKELWAGSKTDPLDC